MSMTTPMKRALVMLHGSAKTAKEAKADSRSLMALERLGLARWSGRSTRKLWSLTMEGNEAASKISLEEVGL